MLRVPHALTQVKCRLYQTCQSIAALNGDMCHLEEFVLAKKPGAEEAPLVLGRLYEILQICHLPSQHRNLANFVLLEMFEVTGLSAIYLLPQIKSTGWDVLPASVSHVRHKPISSSNDLFL